MKKKLARINIRHLLFAWIVATELALLVYIWSPARTLEYKVDCWHLSIILTFAAFSGVLTVHLWPKKPIKEPFWLSITRHMLLIWIVTAALNSIIYIWKPVGTYVLPFISDSNGVKLRYRSGTWHLTLVVAILTVVAVATVLLWPKKQKDE